MKLVLLLRSPRWRKRGMWMTNGCWTTPVSNLWAGLNPEPSLVHNHKVVLDRTMCVTTTDFKGILDQIVKSWEQWIMQALQGLEDLEMTGEIGLVGISNPVFRWESYKGSVWESVKNCSRLCKETRTRGWILRVTRSCKPPKWCSRAKHARSWRVAPAIAL